MRVSHKLLVDTSLARLQNRLSAFEKTQVRLGTGKQFDRSSQNVSGMNLSLTLRAERRSIEQAMRNGEDGRARVNLADSKIQQILTALHRVRDLAVRGSSTIQQTERDAIAEEMVSIRDSLVALANSTYLDQRLFGGYTSGDAVTYVAGSWTFTGDTGVVNRRISETEIVPVNVTGDEIFGFNAAQDVFTMIDDLEADVRAGDVSTVSNTIDDLDSAADRLSFGLARLGTSGNRIENALSRDLEQLETIRTRQSEVEDVDLAEAVMELQTQEVALQATLGALSLALQPSLVDFLV